MGGEARRPTIRDVARIAGTSYATVSRYLNGRSYVSRAAAEAIEAAIHQVGYAPNRSARSLVNRQARAIAYVVREHPDLFFADPNLGRMTIGANAALADAGYQMFIVIVDTPESTGRVAELVRGGVVDGAILVAMHVDDPAVPAMAESGTPLVTASRPVAACQIPSVDTDNTGGTAAITSMLAATGRRRIGEIHGPVEAPVSTLRHTGFVTALGEAFDPGLVVTARGWTAEEGAVAMVELLARAPDIDGVVAASDLLAAGALDVLGSRGRRVPGDVGVVGFDDAAAASRTRPPLSTVRQDAAETGRRMADLIVRQVRGEDLTGHHEIVPARVVWRESGGRLPDNPAAG